MKSSLRDGLGAEAMRWEYGKQAVSGLFLKPNHENVFTRLPAQLATRRAPTT